VDEARRDGWLGFQITAPHKQRVMGLLDEVEPDARRIGAVNSVAVDADERLVGFNTDVWWTGLADPSDVMREAVAPLLARGDLQP
jgi:shikimate 5-dehydrogenase